MLLTAAVHFLLPTSSLLLANHNASGSVPGTSLHTFLGCSFLPCNINHANTFSFLFDLFSSETEDEELVVIMHHYCFWKPSLQRRPYCAFVNLMTGIISKTFKRNVGRLNK